MLQEFTIRIQNNKTGKIELMQVFAFDYDMALCMVSEVTACQENLVVLGF